eukprot:2992507-Amphidinium_carterae.1
MSPEGNMCLYRALGRILQELEHEHGEMDEYRFKDVMLDWCDKHLVELAGTLGMYPSRLTDALQRLRPEGVMGDETLVAAVAMKYNVRILVLHRDTQQAWALV